VAFYSLEWRFHYKLLITITTIVHTCMITPSIPWFDAPDAEVQVHARLRAGEITADEQRALLDFIQQGYAILPERISSALIDQVLADIQQAHLHREDIVLRKGGQYSHPGALGVVGKRKRIIDFHAYSTAALHIALAAPITRFLSLLYNEAPLAFQSLLFQYGSRQAMHRDPAYVVTGRPAWLTATWVALEDIVPGSGELAYYPGSHRCHNILFEGGKTTWSRQVDSLDSHESYINQLVSTCEAVGLQRQIFRAQQGQILVWHADLVHGGSPVENPDQTRRSFVTHYCPLSDSPAYLRHTADEGRYVQGDGFYASRHYDIPNRTVRKAEFQHLWETPRQRSQPKIPPAG
jgi:hypothetical protein